MYLIVYGAGVVLLPYVTALNLTRMSQIQILMAPITGQTILVDAE